MDKRNAAQVSQIIRLALDGELIRVADPLRPREAACGQRRRRDPRHLATCRIELDALVRDASTFDRFGHFAGFPAHAKNYSLIQHWVMFKPNI
ncbi:MAG: hypothetical protein OXI55_15055 [Gammaproteobacteria bacterium]|nr:hypothetical protein [Gammaproteobacteria bacterium]